MMRRTTRLAVVPFAPACNLSQIVSKKAEKIEARRHERLEVSDRDGDGIPGAAMTSGDASHFRAHGFTIIRGAVSESAIAEIDRHLHHFIQTELPSLPSESAFYLGVGRTGLWHIHALGLKPFFRQMPIALGWQRIAERLLGKPGTPNVPQLIDKPPSLWHVTPAHQDCAHARRHGFVTFWLALDESTAESGCLRFVDRSHQAGCRPHRRCAEPGFALALADYSSDDRAREVAASCAPGDLSIHHSDTIHSSGTNRGGGHRRALVTVFSVAQTGGES